MDAREARRLGQARLPGPITGILGGLLAGTEDLGQGGAPLCPAPQIVPVDEEDPAFPGIAAGGEREASVRGDGDERTGEADARGAAELLDARQPNGGHREEVEVGVRDGYLFGLDGQGSAVRQARQDGSAPDTPIHHRLHRPAGEPFDPFAQVVVKEAVQPRQGDAGLLLLLRLSPTGFLKCEFGQHLAVTGEQVVEPLPGGAAVPRQRQDRFQQRPRP